MDLPQDDILLVLAQGWLDEDARRGDVTSRLVLDPDARGKARIEARSDGIVAGLRVVAACFRAAGGDELKWVPEVHDGSRVHAGDVMGRVEGSLASILLGERVALNILGRMCGIATLAARYVAEVAGSNVQVVDTRKTTPGLRLLEKYAVAVGGASNHRFGLDDGILIKDNHVAAAGGVHVATRRAVEGAPHGLKVEVEVVDISGLREAIDAGADVVMLDNMTPAQVREAVEVAAGRVVLEASGGITLENIKEYAATGVDLISAGALTHSVPALDVALEVEG